jgi:hypothetical protein
MSETLTQNYEHVRKRCTAKRCFAGTKYNFALHFQGERSKNSPITN